MAQNPFKVDQIQIEPGSAGTRKMRRNADGSLEFVDPSHPSGIKLSTLADSGATAVTATLKQGTASFVAEHVKAIVFGAVYADAVYVVQVEFAGNPGGAWWVTAKTAAGFTINLAGDQTVNVAWATVRLG